MALSEYAEFGEFVIMQVLSRPPGSFAPQPTGATFQALALKQTAAERYALGKADNILTYQVVCDTVNGTTPVTEKQAIRHASIGDLNITSAVAYPTEGVCMLLGERTI